MEQNVENKISIRFVGITLCLIFIAIIGGLFLGVYLNVAKTSENTEVYLDGTKQTFRNANGAEIYPLEKDGILYMPVNKTGSFLDYMTIEDEKGLSLYGVEDTSQKVLAGWSTKTLDGESITDAVFANSDYTVVMLWSTTCQYCKEELTDLVNFNEYMTKNNIQFICVGTDLGFYDNPADIDRSVIDGIIGDFNGTVVYKDELIDSKYQRGTYSLPKQLIIDREGNLVKILEGAKTTDELIQIFDAIRGE